MTEDRGPLHLRGEVLATKRLGGLRMLTLALPGVAQRSRPGNFLAVAAGESRLAPRPLWIRRVQSGGPHGDTVDVVVEPRGPGTRWLAERPVGATVEVTGPLGRPFSLPREPVACLLVAEGISAAAVLPLGERLRERGCSVELVVSAERADLLLPSVEARRVARRVTVVTADGSAGARGSLVERGAALVSGSEAQVVYAAGRPEVLAVIAAASARSGLPAQVAVDLPLPCGTGLCHGCPLPVVGSDGVPRQVRACLEGPVVRADRVRWGDL